MLASLVGGASLLKFFVLVYSLLDENFLEREDVPLLFEFEEVLLLLVLEELPELLELPLYEVLLLYL